MTIKKLKQIIEKFNDDDRIVISGEKGEVSLDNEILFLQKLIPFNNEEPIKLIVAQTRNEIDIPTELEARLDYYQEENWKESDTVEDLLEIGFKLDDFKYSQSRYKTMKIKLERNKAEAEMTDMIDMLAEKVIQLYEINVPVNDINEIVNKIGGTVEELKTIYSKNNSYLRLADDEFSIVIPTEENIENKNMIIAKQLGHLFLHLNFKNTKNEEESESKQYRYYRFSDPLTDYQAKQFALAFLMPKDAFIKTVKEHAEGTYIDTSEIARHFHVPIEDAAERGYTLDLFNK